MLLPSLGLAYVMLLQREVDSPLQLHVNIFKDREL
jgi:hypothetical protein